MPRTRKELPEHFARVDALVELLDPTDRYLDCDDAPLRSSMYRGDRDRRQIVDVARMRQLRELCGLSIDRAAAFAGVGRNTLQRLEAGESDPKVSTMLLLLALYGRIQGERISLDDVVERAS